MLNNETIKWIDDCEWIIEIDPGAMGDHYLEETYKLKDGAPDNIKKKWEEICSDFRLAG